MTLTRIQMVSDLHWVHQLKNAISNNPHANVGLDEINVLTQIVERLIPVASKSLEAETMPDEPTLTLEELDALERHNDDRDGHGWNANPMSMEEFRALTAAARRGLESEWWNIKSPPKDKTESIHKDCVWGVETEQRAWCKTHKSWECWVGNVPYVSCEVYDKPTTALEVQAEEIERLRDMTDELVEKMASAIDTASATIEHKETATSQDTIAERCAKAALAVAKPEIERALLQELDEWERNNGDEYAAEAFAKERGYDLDAKKDPAQSQAGLKP